ncbi:MAG TPA: hypothetical protein VI729_11475 [Anaerolineales bacterium]|nr:MAG: hypothetical protein A2Z37_15165 [Chloroflexi bacterium RBG_19FT_COMBO_62_14]HLE05215.1 hypothetical protein [Anaerolineales bacterium]
MGTGPRLTPEKSESALRDKPAWANSLAEPAAALRSYHSALALGNTAALPELFKAAGTKFEFDVEALREATALIERTIAELQAG